MMFLPILVKLCLDFACNGNFLAFLPFLLQDTLDGSPRHLASGELMRAFEQRCLPVLPGSVSLSGNALTWQGRIKAFVKAGLFPACFFP